MTSTCSSPSLLERAQSLYSTLFGHGVPTTASYEDVLAGLAAGCDEILVELPNSLHPDDAQAECCQVVLRAWDAARQVVALVVPPSGLGTVVMPDGTGGGEDRVVPVPLRLPIRAWVDPSPSQEAWLELDLCHVEAAFAAERARALLPPSGFLAD